MAITYNMHNDYYHGIGYQDEDMDYELPDPYDAMHQKHKRSPVFMYICGWVTVAIVVGYPTLGLKMPQKDNPVQYRKKFGTPGLIHQMQSTAMVEYGGTAQNIDSNVIMGGRGFQQIGNGFRMDLDSYQDLIC